MGHRKYIRHKTNLQLLVCCKRLRCTLGPNWEAVADADRLWDDFTKDHNESRRKGNCGPSTAENTVEYNWECLVDNDVANLSHDRHDITSKGGYIIPSFF